MACDNSSLSTTTDKNPPLVRQANKILASNEDKQITSKDEHKKEIRRDSKTGFEKFDDYFDSSFDDTTLKSPNVTTANNTKVDKGTYILECLWGEVKI